MRIVALIVLIFGVTLAGAGVYFAKTRYDVLQAALAQQQATQVVAAPEIKTVSVLVASRALKYGEVLKEEDIKEVRFPEEAVPGNSFTTREDLFGDGGEDDRRIVLRAIEQNEPIFRAKVTGFGERATISAQLTPGMRAFTLRIDTVSGVAGFLLPNDRVDVFLTRKGQDGLSSNLIMQNVKVIAVDQFSDKDSNRARVARTATVEVSPEDAQRLALAQQVGRISLSLRQIDEVATTVSDETPSIGMTDLIKKEEAAPAPAPAPKKQLCERKGTELFCRDE